jgi:formylglycine-generating enzyme required for sulfatase activity
MMGTPDDELGHEPNETQYQATISREFWIMEREITQEQFLGLMDYNPANFPLCGGDCPVEGVSWHEVAAYANALSLRDGLTECYDCTGRERTTNCDISALHSSPYDCSGYRLPTEAEWEYAARAGNTGATYNGELDVVDCRSSTVLDPIAWHCGNSEATPHPVGELIPNAWGLYDMMGNVWEWCHDWFLAAYPSAPQTDPTGPTSGSDRVLRGGSWRADADRLRAGNRHHHRPSLRNEVNGGRLAKSGL